MKQINKFLTVLSLVSLALLAFAQGTVGGTIISNTATATFTDSNNVSRTTQSNTVQTTVQTVYSFDISPDDAMTPTVASDFAGYTDTDGLNTTGGAIGDTVTFTYTITNNTNNDPADPLTVSLDTGQYSGDDFDLINVTIYVDDDLNTADSPDADGDGIPDNYVVYTPGTDTLELAAQGDSATIYIKAEIPTGVDGNDVALIDLIATNDDAVTAGDTGANVSYESNNMGRVEVDEDPIIGAAKELGTVVNNGDGTYSVPYTITLENFGNVALSSIQVIEDLAAVFGTLDTTGALDAGGYRLSTASGETLASSDFAVNSSFNGDTDTNLLTPATSANDLAIAATGTITFTVIVNPGSNPGPYNNSVTAYGFSPDDEADTGVDKSDPVTDSSTNDDSANGADPDPNNDGDPSDDPEDSEDTPVTFTQNPQIGVAKEAGTITDNGDGTFTLPFTITLENLGDMDLHDVQITEDLTDFGSYVAALGDVDAAGEYTIDITTVSGFGITTNTAVPLALAAGFNGDGVTGMLDVAAGGSLAVAETATIEFELTFYPDFANLPFTNQVTATGDLPVNNDGTVDNDSQDLSDDGTNPDTDGDGLANEQVTAYDADGNGTIDPGEGTVADGIGDGIGNDTTTNENDPTTVTLTLDAQIGAAKQAGTIVDNADGTFTVPFTITLENFGNVDLHDVQVTEDLAAEFGTFGAATPTAAGNYTVSGLSITTNATHALTVNVIGTGAGEFNGSGSNTNILNVASGGYIQPTETVTIEFDLTFYPDFANAPFTNQVTAEGDDPTNDDGTTDGDASDDSTDGTDPDGTDGDDTPDENDPTPITVTKNPVIGVAKEVSAGPTSNGDGSFDVDFSFVVENLGNVDLYDIQVTDLLSGEFGTHVALAADVDTAGEYTVSDPVVTDATTAPLLSANTGFTGSGLNTGLLTVSGTAALEVGETVTVEFTLTFYPNVASATVTGSDATFENQATASGDEPDASGDGDGTADGDSTDLSDEGTDPDPGDGAGGAANGDPTDTDEDDPTEITITMAPVIGVAKQAGTVTNNGDGTFDVTYTINVENLGNVDAHDVQVTEDLAAEFGSSEAVVDAAGEFTVSAVNITTNATNVLDGNTAFDGEGDTGLLDVAAGGHIRPGETVTLEFTLTFYPDFSTASMSGTDATFNNQVTAEADNPSNNDGTTDGDSTDLSDVGTDPDPGDGAGGAANGDPTDTDEDDPTEITITMAPVIGVAKDASVTGYDLDSDNGVVTAGPFEITFNFYLENMGNVDLTNVSLTDNLATQFGTLNVSPSPLIAGEYEVISVTKISGPTTVTANSSFNGSTNQNLIPTTSSLLVGETAQISLVIEVFDPGAYTNQATASADGPGTTTTTDDSDNGTDPDGATNNDDPTDSDDPTPINLDALALDKSVRTCITVDCSDINDPIDATGATAEPGQYLEYTIVAQNVGGQDLTNIFILDEIPTWTLPVAGSAQYIDGANTTATIECSDDNGATWLADCFAGLDPAITDVRLNVGTLTADDNAAGGTDEATLTFVVFVP